MKFTTIKKALEYVGGFNKPSKMPCDSYNLPIEECKTGSKLMKVKGTTCSFCYGAKGLYKLYEKNTLPSQYKHLEAIKKPFWVAAMAFVINKRESSHFRFHDVGDVQDINHFIKLCELAKQCSKTLFWLPSREYSIISQYVNMGLEIPKNLIVRLSAYKIESKGPESLAKRLGVLVSTVKREGYNCPAPKQQNECKDCRACWDKNVFDITYKLH